ncbi:MAG: hypothetical protein KatS3mg125_0076 [Lysobacterales bacterium]|jgi:hypothetical protein|nr:MAG: hypothetical protein KatS3mg125_0076 [Xanthomonadales bacterium]
MFSSLFASSLTVALLASSFAVWMGFSMFAHARRRRWLRSVLRLGFAVLGLALAAYAGTLALASRSYERLLAEQEAARVAVRAVGPSRFYLQLTAADGRVRGFTLEAEQWRLEGRVVRFSGWARRLGFSPLYRLERLSGRFTSAAREQREVAQVLELAGEGLDLALLAAQLPRMFGFIENEFGSGVFMPLFDGARYRVLIGPQGGFSAVPEDERTAAELRRLGF